MVLVNSRSDYSLKQEEKRKMIIFTVRYDVSCV